MSINHIEYEDKLESKLKNCSNCNSIFNTNDYVLMSDAKEILKEALKDADRFSVCSRQAEIVKQRLAYHFRKPDGSWNIPKGMPFMKEFLNEVDKLCKCSRDQQIEI